MGPRSDFSKPCQGVVEKSANATRKALTARFRRGSQPVGMSIGRPAARVQTAACKPSTAAVQTISAGKKTEQMVWVPTHGGKKYHSKSTCSNMKDPEKVTLSKAKAEGFTACKKCY